MCVASNQPSSLARRRLNNTCTDDFYVDWVGWQSFPYALNVSIRAHSFRPIKATIKVLSGLTAATSWPDGVWYLPLLPIVLLPWRGIVHDRLVDERIT